jgi:RNA-binding protein YlmH
MLNKQIKPKDEIKKMSPHETDELIKKRLLELANRSYAGGKYVFSDFLNMQEISCYHMISSELSFASPCLWGGFSTSERQMLRFGDQDALGYEEDFPIAYLKIEPVAPKFADKLSHRDFLGAVINLGLERACLGDILIREKTAYLICVQNIADYICQNLERVKHTTVCCTPCVELPKELEPKLRAEDILVASDRIDAVIAKVYNLSRSQTVELFAAHKIFLNGRLCENNSAHLRPDDVISVRGFGRFIFAGLNHINKKGKQNLLIYRYGD